MFLNKDIIMSYVTALKGDPVEIISCAHRPAILVKCHGVSFSVNINDLVGERPSPADIPIKKETVNQITQTRISVHKPKQLPVKKLTASQKSLY